MTSSIDENTTHAQQNASCGVFDSTFLREWLARIEWDKSVRRATASILYRIERDEIKED